MAERDEMLRAHSAAEVRDMLRQTIQKQEGRIAELERHNAALTKALRAIMIYHSPDEIEEQPALTQARTALDRAQERAK